MTRKDAINTLVEVIEKRDYGDVIDYKEIGYIIQQTKGTQAYNSIVQAAKKRLELAGHAVVNERGIGYKVCRPDDYTGEGVRYMRLGAKRIDRGAKIINHAPVNDMSQPAREAHNRVNDRMTRLQAAMAGASVEIHMLSTADKHPLLAAKVGS